MTYSNFIEVGRVVYIHFGAERGKLAVIIDVLNENKVLIDGPTTGVERQIMPIKRINLTRFRVPVLRNARTGNLIEAIKKFDLAKKWEQTSAAKKIALRTKRARLNDFDRFKAMVFKRRFSHGVKHQTAVAVKGDKKGGKKPAETKKTGKK